MNYEEYLKEEIEKAVKEFETAKETAAREIETLNARDAVQYGAGYCAKIEEVTAAASKAIAFDRALKAYQRAIK